ncbi:MAG: hypothetical protein AAFP99_00515 [Pseudomonadota bacterium]
MIGLLKFTATILIALAMGASAAFPVHATTGPGCLRVVNVPAGDVLNVRAGASSNSAIVDRISPKAQGILALRSQCIPLSASMGPALVSGDAFQWWRGD